MTDLFSPSAVDSSNNQTYGLDGLGVGFNSAPSDGQDYAEMAEEWFENFSVNFKTRVSYVPGTSFLAPSAGRLIKNNHPTYELQQAGYDEVINSEGSGLGLLLAGFFHDQALFSELLTGAESDDLLRITPSENEAAAGLYKWAISLDGEAVVINGYPDRNDAIDADLDILAAIDLNGAPGYEPLLEEKLNRISQPGKLFSLVSGHLVPRISVSASDENTVNPSYISTFWYKRFAAFYDRKLVQAKASYLRLFAGKNWRDYIDTASLTRDLEKWQKTAGSKKAKFTELLTLIKDPKTEFWIFFEAFKDLELELPKYFNASKKENSFNQVFFQNLANLDIYYSGNRFWLQAVDDSYLLWEAVLSEKQFYLGEEEIDKAEGQIPDWCLVKFGGGQYHLEYPLKRRREGYDPIKPSYEAFRSYWRVGLDVMATQDPRAIAVAVKMYEYLRGHPATETNAFFPIMSACLVKALLSAYERNNESVLLSIVGQLGADESAYRRLALDNSLKSYLSQINLDQLRREKNYYDQAWYLLGKLFVSSQPANGLYNLNKEGDYSAETRGFGPTAEWQLLNPPSTWVWNLVPGVSPMNPFREIEYAKSISIKDQKDPQARRLKEWRNAAEKAFSKGAYDEAKAGYVKVLNNIDYSQADSAQRQMVSQAVHDLGVILEATGRGSFSRADFWRGLLNKTYQNESLMEQLGLIVSQNDDIEKIEDCFEKYLKSQLSENMDKEIKLWLDKLNEILARNAMADGRLSKPQMVLNEFRVYLIGVSPTDPLAANNNADNPYLLLEVAKSLNSTNIYYPEVVPICFLALKKFTEYKTEGELGWTDFLLEEIPWLGKKNCQISLDSEQRGVIIETISEMVKGLAIGKEYKAAQALLGMFIPIDPADGNKKGKQEDLVNYWRGQKLAGQLPDLWNIFGAVKESLPAPYLTRLNFALAEVYKRMAYDNVLAASAPDNFLRSYDCLNLALVNETSEIRRENYQLILNGLAEILSIRRFLEVNCAKAGGKRADRIRNILEGEPERDFINKIVGRLGQNSYVNIPINLLRIGDETEEAVALAYPQLSTTERPIKKATWQVELLNRTLMDKDHFEESIEQAIELVEEPLVGWNGAKICLYEVPLKLALMFKMAGRNEEAYALAEAMALEGEKAAVLKAVALPGETTQIGNGGQIPFLVSRPFKNCYLTFEFDKKVTLLEIVAPAGGWSNVSLITVVSADPRQIVLQIVNQGQTYNLTLATAKSKLAESRTIEITSRGVMENIQLANSKSYLAVLRHTEITPADVKEGRLTLKSLYESTPEAHVKSLAFYNNIRLWHENIFPGGRQALFGRVNADLREWQSFYPEAYTLKMDYLRVLFRETERNQAALAEALTEFGTEADLEKMIIDDKAFTYNRQNRLDVQGLLFNWLYTIKTDIRADLDDYSVKLDELVDRVLAEIQIDEPEDYFTYLLVRAVKIALLSKASVIKREAEGKPDLDTKAVTTVLKDQLFEKNTISDDYEDQTVTFLVRYRQKFINSEYQYFSF